jgi:hypothetical protein
MMKSEPVVQRRSFLGKLGVTLTGLLASGLFMYRGAASTSSSSEAESAMPQAQSRVRIHPQAVKRTPARSMPND